MKKILTFLIAIACMAEVISAQQRQIREKGLQDSLLLKDYFPQSIFNVPLNLPQKAKFPAIDMHMHAPRGGGNLDSIAKEIIASMDAVGVQKTILFCGTGSTFDRYAETFGKYPDRFELWCGFDFSGYDKPDFVQAAIAELERCVDKGAKGIGEISDKGAGFVRDAATQLHIDDPRLDPLLEKAADLKLPINFHAADPIWMYEKMDEKNDLLYEAYYYRLDNKKGILGHKEVLATLEKAIQKHPRTTFIACHFMNLTYDLNRLGELFDRYPNLYADCSQREAYIASIPRFSRQFIEKYADRMVWGTDQGFSLPMYRNSFHILETEDEHFYAWDVSNTRWCLYGIGLSDKTLKKLYRDNALKILKK